MTDIELVKGFKVGQIGRVRTELHDMLGTLGASHGIRWMPTAAGFFLQSPYIQSGMIVLTEDSVTVTVTMKKLYRLFVPRIRRELEAALMRIGA